MKDSHLEHGRTSQKIRTRDSILQAASKLLESPAPITMEQVAKEANISRATIYRYYSNAHVLSAEAALHHQSLTPIEVFEKFQGKNWHESFLGIQGYFNQLTTSNEPLFRKYLSVILDPDSGINQRGARRVKALNLSLDEKSLPKNADREKVIAIATLLMGIEAFIVAKDVCNMDNNRATETLAWGLETFLKGLEVP